MAHPTHDWFLKQWLDHLRVKQAALSRLTGWDKRKTSYLVNGKQPFNREDVNQVCRALSIAPFELLMHPEDAFALRRMRDVALRIAAETTLPWNGAELESGNLDRDKTAISR